VTELSLPLRVLFVDAYRFCLQRFPREVEIVEGRRFSQVTPSYFLKEYVYVVVNSGMRNSVAEKIFQEYLKRGVEAIRHPDDFWLLSPVRDSLAILSYYAPPKADRLSKRLLFR
jgi:hypothetical protein